MRVEHELELRAMGMARLSFGSVQMEMREGEGKMERGCAGLNTELLRVPESSVLLISVAFMR